MKFSLVLVILLVSIVTFLVVTEPSNADTFYVREGGTGDGSSWINATGTLQFAIDSGTVGDSVWVSSGTYYPTTKFGGVGDRDKAFRLKNGVNVLGGFPSTGSPSFLDRNTSILSTILSGDIGLPGTPTDNCYHVVSNLGTPSYTTTPILRNLVIKDGYGSLQGGGIISDANSLVLDTCKIADNSAFVGGGVSFVGSSTLTASNCIFSNNSADDSCGFAYLASNSIFVGDSCLLQTNNAAVWGGALCLSTGAKFELTNSVLNSNTASVAGGHINWDTAQNLFLTNCVLYKGEAPNGGAIQCSAGTLVAVNTIFWGNENTNLALRALGGNFLLSHCNLQNPPPSFSGTSNITGSPMFVSPSLGNFHLSASSPCIDVGSSGYINLPATDYEGDSRTRGEGVDIGADESPYTILGTSSSSENGWNLLENLAGVLPYVMIAIGLLFVLGLLGTGNITAAAIVGAVTISIAITFAGVALDLVDGID